MMECRHRLRCYSSAAGDSTGCKFTSEWWLLDIGIIMQIWRNMRSNRIWTTSYVWTAYIPDVESSWLLYCTFTHSYTTTILKTACLVYGLVRPMDYCSLYIITPGSKNIYVILLHYDVPPIYFYLIEFHIHVWILGPTEKTRPAEQQLTK